MKKKKLIVVLILSFLFIVNSFLVVFDKTVLFDNKVYSFLKSFECVFLDNYFIFITKFGNPLLAILLVAFFVVFIRNKHSLMILIVSIFSFISNTFFKYLFQRERPSVVKMIEQGGYSYPSGHAMISVAIYGYLLYVVLRRVRDKYLRIILSSLLILLILSIGISRIYLGVHYASDILGGFLLAIVELILLCSYSDKKIRGN